MTITHVSPATSRPELHTVVFTPRTLTVDADKHPRWILYYIVENTNDYYGDRFPAGSVIIRDTSYDRFPPFINKVFDVHNDKWGSTTGRARLYEGMDFLVIPPDHPLYAAAHPVATAALQTIKILNL